MKLNTHATADSPQLVFFRDDNTRLDPIQNGCLINNSRSQMYMSKFHQEIILVFNSVYDSYIHSSVPVQMLCPDLTGFSECNLKLNRFDSLFWVTKDIMDHKSTLINPLLKICTWPFF